MNIDFFLLFLSGFGDTIGNSNLMSRRRITGNSSYSEQYHALNNAQETNNHNINQWKRIVLLIVAITVHNIPGKILIFSGNGVKFASILIFSLL